MEYFLSLECERTPRTETSPLHAPITTLSSGSLTRPRRFTWFWQELPRWVQTNTLAPQWLPQAWRRPLLGYLVALVLEVVVVSVTFFLLHPLPSFGLQALMVLGVLVVALTCGAGPGILATLVGAVLLDGFVLFPHLSRPVENICVVLVVLVGFSISLIAGQHSRARRQTEELACSLSAEKAISELESQRLRTLLDVLPAAVGMINAQGQLLEVNPALKALWSERTARPGEAMPLQEQGGWSHEMAMPLAFAEGPIRRALNLGERTINEEMEIKTGTGQHKVFLDSVAPIHNETGEIAGSVLIAQDITERKRLEREVSERAAQLEAIFESIADGVIVTDAQGRLLHLNQSFRTLLGLEVETKGLTLPDLQRIAGFALFNEQGQPITEAECPITSILQGEVLTGKKHVNFFVHTRAGREVLINGSGAPVRGKSGRLLGAVQVWRDVTEQHRLEQHTRDALCALLEMAEVLVHVQAVPSQAEPISEQALQQRPDPTLSAVARRLAELTRRVLGCQHVSLVTVEPETLVLHPLAVVGLCADQEAQWWANWNQRPHCLEEHLPSSMVAALQAGDPVTLDRTHPPKCGWQQLSSAQTSLLTPICIGEALGGVLEVDYGAEDDRATCPNARVLSKAVARLSALVLERERLLLERAEARANELALRETTQQMDTFLGMAGHELKNPLAILKLSTQLATRRLHQLVNHEVVAAREVEAVLHPLASMGYQVERLERLVNDVLDVSRVRAGKLDLRPAFAELTTIVRKAVEEQREIAPTRVLRLRVPHNERAMIYADADRIGQVVTNYLTNALKYSPEDRPVFVGLEVNGHEARVWVRDEGPGLPLEEQARIWDRFHRAKGIEVQGGTGVGLGLGLHICRTIIERQQGQVGVVSAPGQGSTFWFTLPLASALLSLPGDERRPAS